MALSRGRAEKSGISFFVVAAFTECWCAQHFRVAHVRKVSVCAAFCASSFFAVLTIRLCPQHFRVAHVRNVLVCAAFRGPSYVAVLAELLVCAACPGGPCSESACVRSIPWIVAYCCVHGIIGLLGISGWSRKVMVCATFSGSSLMTAFTELLVCAALCAK